MKINTLSLVSLSLQTGQLQIFTSKVYYFFNTLRHPVNNEEKWWAGVKAFTTNFKKSQLYTTDVLNFFNKYFDYDFEKIFDQYLYFNDIPTLEISKQNGKLSYRWQSDVSGFDMPIDVKMSGKKMRLYPKEVWQILSNQDELTILEQLFYINVKYV